MWINLQSMLASLQTWAAKRQLEKSFREAERGLVNALRAVNTLPLDSRGTDFHYLREDIITDAANLMRIKLYHGLCTNVAEELMRIRRESVG